MANILIVFGSTTGNTGTAADIAAKTLSGAGHSVTVKEVTDVSPDNLCQGHDCVLFGCSTWGDSEIELQSDFAEFFESFDKIDAANCKTAVFGCGEEGYTFFCGAVDAIEERLAELGSKKIAMGLKIDGDPSSAESEITYWAKQVAEAL